MTITTHLQLENKRKKNVLVYSDGRLQSCSITLQMRTTLIFSPLVESGNIYTEKQVMFADKTLDTNHLAGQYTPGETTY